MKSVFSILLATILFPVLSISQITTVKPITNNNIAEVKAPAPKPVAFRLAPFSGTMTLPANVSSSVGTILNLTVKEFDLGSNTSGSSFVAPENGVYHFDIRLTIGYSVADYQEYLRFYLMLNKNGGVIEKTVFMNPQTDKTPTHTLAISTTIMLKKGDTLNASYNADANSAGKSVAVSEVSFSGFKVSGMDGVAGNGGTIR